MPVMSRLFSTAAVVMAALLMATCVTAGTNEVSFIYALFAASGNTLAAGTDVCTLTGITCDVGRNVANQTSYGIDLNNRNWKMTYLPTIDGSNLDIYKIDLSGNGGIVARPPDSWAEISYLQELNLANTAVYGAIPDSWKGLHALETVRMNNCGLCYSIPDWTLSSMPNLTTVDFSHNDLWYWSEAFGTFSASTKLTSLNINNNNFCGCLPSTWSSSLLINAATSASSASVASNCGSQNKCSGKTCKGKDGVSAAATAWSTLFLCLFAAAALVMA